MGICITPASFAWDQNMDGITTISDFFSLTKNIFGLPGNIFLQLLDSPSLNGFFEISYQNCNGFISAMVSLFVWFIIIPLALK